MPSRGAHLIGIQEQWFNFCVSGILYIDMPMQGVSSIPRYMLHNRPYTCGEIAQKTKYSRMQIYRLAPTVPFAFKTSEPAIGVSRLVQRSVELGRLAKAKAR